MTQQFTWLHLLHIILCAYNITDPNGYFQKTMFIYKLITTSVKTSR